jgi:hypothetical protein
MSTPNITWESFEGRLADDCDLININIEPNAVDSSTVEFVIESGDDVTWWKGLLVPDCLGSSWEIWTKDQKKSDRVSLWAEQVHNGQLLEFRTTVDGANPSFIRSLKLQIGEEAEHDQVIARYRSEKLGDATKNMKIVPVNFNTEHKAMLGHCKMILENDGGRIAINPDKFDKLITSLRTAVDNDGVLDKEATSYDDLFDAFRLALKFYSYREK